LERGHHGRSHARRPAPGDRAPKGNVAFTTLAQSVGDEWKSSGTHRDASDPKFDHAVVHASNDMPYRSSSL